MILVPNEPAFFEFIRTIRLHPENIHGFLEKELFSEEAHIRYMEKYGANYFVALNTQKDPVGYIGEVDFDLRLAVHPWHKGKGVGQFMLKRYIQINPFHNSTFRAKVLLDNKASRTLFEKLGFVQTHADDLLAYYAYTF
jgi:RimJ/RimL family protein N-acetyltransferase